MTDASSDDLQQFSTEVSRRCLITAAAMLAVVGAVSPAAAQIQQEPKHVGQIRFSNPDTMQKPSRQATAM